MTQTPNTGGTPGDAPNRATPSTGAERVPPVAPPPGDASAAPAPPTAAKPTGPPQTADRTHTDLTSADRTHPDPTSADRTHADPDRAVPARPDESPDASRTATPSGSRTTASPGRTETPAHSGRPLFAAEQREKFDARIHQAVAGFVENPRQAVQEADAAFDDVVAGLTEALAERSRLLRADRDGGKSEAGTEDLRIALQQYRDLTERLVRL
ncbi:hypothetical protein GTY66_18950 [Streptomyces sp. SID8356]|uniref:hypothetical protein n=1 Tax=unclassified Streptomyces TaxID=2593676 RepID=UPI000381337C|nr:MULTISPECIES: hypothetical protein [unclassified Streptomyces]MYT38114.1 hypothetical protein [Streptomyces sp. SID8356]